jgi:hypothetical protein
MFTNIGRREAILTVPAKTQVNENCRLAQLRLTQVKRAPGPGA